MKKQTKQLLISYLTLLIANVILKFSLNELDISEILTNFVGAVIISLIFAAISWLIYLLIKKKSSFIKALCYSNYIFSALAAFSYIFGFLFGYFS